MSARIVSVNLLETSARSYSNFTKSRPMDEDSSAIPYFTRPLVRKLMSVLERNEWHFL